MENTSPLLPAAQSQQGPSSVAQATEVGLLQAKAGKAKSRARKQAATQLARRVLVRALLECDGEIDNAAKKIGVSPATFADHMRQYQLPRPIMCRPGLVKSPPLR